jgi:hypothetical protein
MPLSGFPVFRLSPRGRLLANRPLLSWTSAPFRAFTHVLPRRASCDADPARTGGVADFPAALLSVLCSSAHAAARVRDCAGFATSRRCPVPGVSTPSTGSRPLGPPSLASRVYFTPVTLLSFRLRGFVPLGVRDPSPGPSFLAALRRAPTAHAASKVCSLRESVSRAEANPARDPCPPDVPPLRLSLSLPWDRSLRGPSSLALGLSSRPKPRIEPAPRSLALQRTRLLDGARRRRGYRPL